jgi:hypothetical protein
VPSLPVVVLGEVLAAWVDSELGGFCTMEISCVTEHIY